MIKALEGTKEFDIEYEKSGYKDQFRKIEYGEREEDDELKRKYEEKLDSVKNLEQTFKDKIDGEIDIDLHGNIGFREPGVKKGEVKTGIDDAGTYILRDGKLVKGKAEIRE
jgi:hypothetical protein